MTTNTNRPPVPGDPRQPFEQLVANIDGIVWEVDALTFLFTFVSQKAERLLGYPLEQWFAPGFWVDHLHPDDRVRTYEECLQATREKRPHELVYRMIAADGRTVWLRDIVSVTVEGDLVTKLHGVMVDVTVQKRAEEALRRSEAYLAEAQRLSRTGSWAWDVATREFVHWSQEHYRLHGLDPQKGIPSWGEAIQLIHPEDRARCLEGIERAIQERTECALDYRAVLPDGSLKYVHSVAHPVFNAAGELMEFVGTEMDVTEPKVAEEALRASLREKDVLLKEVHHRVKNNLQLISSLLALQAGRLKDRAAAEAFAESQNRVRAMALVHENLYRSGDLASVRLAGHLDSLCTHLVRSYNVDPDRIRLDLRVAEVTLDLDRSLRLGLLVNELVSNAFKHAFPGEQSGRVLVQLDMPRAGCYHLFVSDNGVGLPPNRAPGQSDSLGLQLIADLTEQLGGTLALDRTGGTTFSIRFPAGQEDSRP